MPTSLTELFSPACHLCPRRCGGQWRFWEPDPAAPGGRRRRGDHGGGLAIETLVGVLADAARHEDDDVSLIGIGDADAPALIEEARDPLGVVEVHLASKGLDPIGLTYEGAVTCHYEISSSGPLTWEAAVGPEMRCT